jgi:hypothetical protein
MHAAEFKRLKWTGRCLSYRQTLECSKPWLGSGSCREHRYSSGLLERWPYPACASSIAPAQPLQRFCRAQQHNVQPPVTVICMVM